MQELVELTSTVIAECLTVLESAFAVESQCWFEGGATARLQAQPMETAPARFGNDVLKECGGDAFPEKCWISPHGFQLACSVAEFL